MTFAFEFATATRISFGAGVHTKVGGLVQGQRVLMVSSRLERAAPVLNHLPEAQIHFIAITHEPTVTWMREILPAARDFRPDVVVGIGGGSVLDAGKAIAAYIPNAGDPLDYLEVIGKGQPLTRTPLPYIAIPTTAGTGSEVTSNAVLGSAEHGVKVSLRHPSMLPSYAIVDPTLTLDLSQQMTASIGLDALTQLIEPYTSHAANVFTDLFCREGIVRIAKSLPIVYHNPTNLDARADLAFGAMLSGLALANAKLGAVHGFAGVLGGMFNAPHGALCACLLPHVTAVNHAAMQTRDLQNPALQRYENIAAWVTGESDVMALVAWLTAQIDTMQIPPLNTYGISERDFPTLIERSSRANSMKGNPIVLTTEEMAQILAAAL